MRHDMIELDKLDYELWTRDWSPKPPNKSDQKDIHFFYKQKSK